MSGFLFVLLRYARFLFLGARRPNARVHAYITSAGARSAAHYVRFVRPFSRQYGHSVSRVRSQPFPGHTGRKAQKRERGTHARHAVLRSRRSFVRARGPRRDRRDTLGPRTTWLRYGLEHFASRSRKRVRTAGCRYFRVHGPGPARRRVVYRYAMVGKRFSRVELIAPLPTARCETRDWPFFCTNRMSEPRASPATRLLVYIGR